MGRRTLVRRACVVVALMVSGTLLTPVVAAAQSTAEVPRTAWGDPDLGGTWDFRTITPLERPEQYGDREFLTAEEAATLEQGAVERDRAADEAPARIVTAGEHVGGYNQFWYDHGTAVVEDRRTSLIVDPPNGRRPPRTGDRSAGPPITWIGGFILSIGGSFATEHPESLDDLNLFDRCIGTAALPIYPTAYNNYAQVFQTPDHVALIVEMMRSTRIIPLDGRPHAGIRQGLGDSRGHWEGDTLVVETTNFDDGMLIVGASRAARRLVERFTRVSPDLMRYEFTVDDPSVWTSTWTAVQSLRKTEAPIFEYACHEGNYAVPNMLAGARKADLAERSGR